ncbi:MAG: PP2C family protein-serine/threonine phosphatase, partial [Chloroflexi bacterium]|nr:PP2C family protein-serine/threonine phosphatase [Chloroflexota bacterium]
YDAASGRLRYANAGHNPPYICTADSEATILSEGRGVVIGVETGLDYVVSELTLTPGDVVFLYTDGITEAMGPKREQFTEVRLGEALARNLELAPEALTQAIIDAVRGHTVGVDQNDDMTCVALQHTG